MINWVRNFINVIILVLLRLRFIRAHYLCINENENKERNKYALFRLIQQSTTLILEFWNNIFA